MRSGAESILYPMKECVSKRVHAKGKRTVMREKEGPKVAAENESQGSHVSNGFLRLTYTLTAT